jgi:demethylmenaquinone methyltransferase/2-methoxy-6-polyprenyl-1,4-benzoquinol methylase
LLAEAIGPTGHVTGVDLSPECLRYAEELIKQRGLAEQISFREGDVADLPFDDNTFDWVWSADCVGYPAGDLLPVLQELIRVTRAGGRIAILAWSSQCLLPGYPLLEARLNGTCSSLAPFVTGKPPESHFLRALGRFRQAGLAEVSARTFVGEVPAPLSSELRTALVLLFEMLWGDPQPEVSPEDWAEYQRLCRPESPDFILNVPDYYAFFTYSLFQGRVSKTETFHPPLPLR